ncbi:MAG: ImmA/IrrE family metallo-endopeptidase [Halomonas meridiana]|uniref:ImmA/IrrE family metallo-endopeptidase n=1 Tax=Vreelandella aquamarina TaxID=77097 RepID=UPI0024E22D5C|nr:ImmA/IrrE family metallo-endopeptidase [Halomonas meridiana]MDK2751720.1 ImmA/IrrE family metallo-endopeptidase [Halomonas meridiana]
MTDIQSIYSALHRHGLTKRNLASLMPEWWSPEVEVSPGAAQRAKIYLAKALSLQIRAFSENPPRVAFDLPVEKRFKLSCRTSEGDVAVAVALAKSASRLALGAMENDYSPLSTSAAEIRAQMLSTGAQWIGLTQILDLCWNHGIPVLHLASPLLGKKMDGIAMSIKGRPSIVLSNVRKQGFLLFHLAHELGHIALGHLSENGAIVDDEITKEDSDEGRNSQEVEADRFAIELLTGNADTRLVLPRLVKANTLADIATRFGRERHIDPTHVVLNVAHNNPKLFGLCVGAAKAISGPLTDQDVVRERAMGNLADGLDPDSEHLLRKLIA